jgi:hypothetical protein
MKILKSIGIIIFVVADIFITTHVYAQNTEDTTDNFFHDDLLNNLVGRWHVTSFAHGSPFTAYIDAEWVLHHQYLHIHFKGNEVVPWFGVPMEYEEYIGYNHNQNRYVVNGVSIEGSDDYEGFCYAYRNGNEIKLMQKANALSDTTIVQRMIWEPDSGSWVIQSRPEVDGKEGKLFLDMKLTLVKQQSK